MGGDGVPRRPDLTPHRIPLAAGSLRILVLAAATAEAVRWPLPAGLVLLAGAVIVALAARRRGFALVISLAAALLAARDLRLDSLLPPADLRSNLARRLSRVEFSLTALTDSARVALGPIDLPSEAFAALAGLERPRATGLAVYGQGRVIAWSGPTSAFDLSTLGDGVQVVGSGPTQAVVYVARDPRGRSLVAERPTSAILGDLAGSLSPVSRHPAAVLWRQSLPADQFLLHDHQGTPYALAALPRANPLGGPLETILPRLVRVALLGLALAVALQAAAAAARTGNPGETFHAVLALLASRAVARSDLLAWPRRLFDPTALAVVSPLDVFSSPGDLLLTGLVALAAALTLLLALAAPGRPPRASRSAAIGLLLALALGAAAAVHGLAVLVQRAAGNSDLDLSDFSLVPFEGVRLAVVLGLLLLTLAYTVVVGALAWRIARHLPAQHRWSGAAVALAWSALGLVFTLIVLDRESAVVGWTCYALYALPGIAGLRLEASVGARRLGLAVALAIGCATCLYVLDVVASERVLRSFVARDLAGVLHRHDANVRHLLADVLTETSGEWGADLAGRPPADIAYRIWKESRLSRERCRSAVDAQPPGGETARFSFRLPVPADVREVEPGPVTLQDVPFQGRRLRVLAGSRALPDGTRITVRIAEDPQGLPFFEDLGYPREHLVRGGAAHAEPLIRAGAALTVTGTDGRVVYATAPPGLRVDGERLARALAQEPPFWWTARDEERTWDVLSFSSEDDTRVFSIALPRTALASRLADLIHLLLLLAAVSTVTLALLAAASAELRRRLPGPGWVRSSAYRKTFLGFATGAILAALSFSLYLRGQVETRSVQEIRSRGVASLEFARNILAEFAAAEPGAPIDDGALIWISQTVGYDLALYQGDRLQATSMRELFREGLLKERPEAEAYRALVLLGAPIHTRLERVGSSRMFEASAAVDASAILSLLSVAHERDIRHAQEMRNEPLFLATAGLVLAAALVARLAARRATEPLRALTLAAARVGAGDLDVRIASTRRDEVRALVEAFNRMAEQLHQQRTELGRRTAYLTRLLENATTGILSVDAAGCVTTANSAAMALLGLPLEPGLCLGDRLSAPEFAPLARSLGAAAPPDREELELSLPGATSRRTVSAVLIALPLEEGSAPGRLLLLEDISEIVKSKKLEAWAEMARRIAHEIKNPLTPIQLAAEHVLRVHRDGAAAFDRVLEDCVATILRQVQGLRRIAREFSAYASGPTPVRPVELDVRGWLFEVLQPYTVAPRPGVQVSFAAEPDVGRFFLDPARMQRALVNLVENALQAMPHGGELTVRASRRGGSLVLAVRDTGVGFPDEVRGRLFEPYFSTRDAGTGLGLANARQAAEDHGGLVEVESAPGKGATVSLVLPQHHL